MDEYKIMAETYRNLLRNGKMDEAIAGKQIRIYEFLSDCELDDLCRLVDTAAFNDIIKAYLRMAAEHSGIDKESQLKIENQLRWIFDEKKAREVLNGQKEKR